jgi:hypothetical protein
VFGRRGVLGRLDDFIRQIPDEIGKAGDPEAVFDELVINHVRDLEPKEREELFAALPQWLERRGSRYAPYLVGLLGCVFDQPRLVDRAIEAALARPWPSLRLELMHLSRRFPSERLTAFVGALAADLDRASNDEEREVATRAGITLCFLGDPSQDRACLRRVLAAARKHQGRHISDALGLMRSLFGRTGRVPDVDSLFTGVEKQLARETYGD